MKQGGIVLWGLRTIGKDCAPHPSARGGCRRVSVRARAQGMPLKSRIMKLDAPLDRRNRTRVVCAAAAAESPPRGAEAPVSWAALPGGVIDGGEIVILAIKPSMWRPAIEAAPWLAVVTIGALLIAALRTPLPGLSPTSSAQLILLVGFARLGLAIARWIPTWHVLTNRRIIDIHGVRAPVIISCPLVEIRNTYVRSGAMDKLLRVGTIIFVRRDEYDPPRIWPSIPKPEEVHVEIRRAIEHAIDNHGL